MKKELTKDITRYDGKMRLRMDLKTFKALAISFLIAVAIYFLFKLIIKSTITVFLISVCAFFITALLKLGTVDGITLSDYISKLFKMMLSREESKKNYSISLTDDYRISVLTEKEKTAKERTVDNE